MKKNDFLEEQRQRQRELVEARKARLDPSTVEQKTSEKIELSFSQKLQNFWYYNKWFLIIGAFIAIMIIIAVQQCAARESYDQQVVLFSYDSYMPAEIEAFEAELSKYGEDLNGDGEVKVQIIDCSYGKGETADSQGAKRQKLTAILASNSEALTFIVTNETFDFLETAYPGFFVDLSLDRKDGRAGALPEQFYKNVNDSEFYKELNKDLPEEEEKFELPKGLLLSRRIADKTTVIGQAKGIKERIKAADKLIWKIAE